MARRHVLVGSAVGLVLIGGLVVGHAALAPEPRAWPPAIGAYAEGGAPARDPELEDLLAERLALLEVAVDDERTGRPGGAAERERLDRALRGSPVIARRGPGVVLAWRDLLDALARWAEQAPDARGEGELRRSARAVTDQLAALGLAYYLDGAVLAERTSARGFVLVYRVERVAFVRAGRERQRVLELRRLDRLDVHRTLLGLQTEDAGDPVVLLDEIDDFVADKIEPVLRGAPYELGAGWSERQLGATAGAAIRRELAGRGGVPDVVIASVRRHEARHAIDRARGELRRIPPALAALLGSHPDTPFAQRARAELAAYVSQIANEPVAPQLALWNLAGQALNARWGSPESYVAVVVIEGLARHVGAITPSVHGGLLDRGALAEAALPLAALTDDELRIFARALWHDLYGGTVAPLE